jgi:hypothetical protein
MARRRFEMHHYRQALVRMRQGDSDREIAAARIMGRPKAARLRELAHHGWLDVAAPCPRTRHSRRAGPPAASTTVSTLEAHRERIQGLGRAGRQRVRPSTPR